jgi:septum formation protein
MSSAATGIQEKKLPQIYKNIKIILGSGSSTRKLILEKAGFQFSVIKADIDERSLGDRTDANRAKELVSLLATLKADAILHRITTEKISIDSIGVGDVFLVTGDQVVLFEGKILEKPNSLEEARQFVEGFSGRSCSTVGSLVVTDLSSGRRASGTDSALVHFEEIPRETVDQLLKEGQGQGQGGQVGVMDCAGALMVEHPLVAPCIRRVDGTMNSLMGLSTDLLFSLIDQLLHDKEKIIDK